MNIDDTFTLNLGLVAPNGIEDLGTAVRLARVLGQAGIVNKFSILLYNDMGKGTISISSEKLLCPMIDLTGFRNCLNLKQNQDLLPKANRKKACPSPQRNWAF